MMEKCTKDINKVEWNWSTNSLYPLRRKWEGYKFILVEFIVNLFYVIFLNQHGCI